MTVTKNTTIDTDSMWGLEWCSFNVVSKKGVKGGKNFNVLEDQNMLRPH